MTVENVESRHRASFTSADEASPSGTAALQFSDFVFAVLRGKWIILAAILLTCGAGTFWLTAQPPLYAARMTVAPANNETAGSSGSRQLSRNLGAVVGISLPESQAVSSFDRFMELLTSVRLAKTLVTDTGGSDILKTIFSNQWDEEAERWHPPDSLTFRIKGGILGIFGIPSWSPPSPYQLATYLDRQLRVRAVENSGMRSIEINVASRDFGVELLHRLHNQADRIIRQEEKLRTRKQIAYIERKLQQTSVMNYRTVLTELLSSQEQTMMMLDVDLPYAATLIEPPVATELPVSPQPMKTMFLALAIGVILGLTGAFLRAAWKWQR